MLIAQLTDIHLGFHPDDPSELNRQRLDATVDALLALERKPDLVVGTGDLTDQATPLSYSQLREALGRLPCPVHLIPGNHDLREPLLAAFPHTPTADGFIQYAIEDASDLRILMLDTLEDGRHGGGYCETRAAWLEARLSEQPDRPTLLVAHHPPIQTGIGWMTPGESEPWIERLTAVVSRHRNVVRLIAGHIHRSITTAWAGTAVTVVPSTAPQVALDLREIGRTPDQRHMIVAERPAFGLHLWNGRDLISHLGFGGPAQVLARYNEGMQPLVEHLLDERI
jgi:3',5'-cyclic AMP phosphodiesterase CpdA